MRILLIGDSHSYGYGLSLNQRSFIDQFTAQLEEQGYCPYVTSYVSLPVAKMRDIIAQLPLARFDLIIIQPTQNTRLQLSSFWSLFRTKAIDRYDQHEIRPQPTSLAGLRTYPIHSLEVVPANPLARFRQALQYGLLTLAKPLGLLRQFRSVQHEWMTLIERLHTHRYKVIMLTSVPQREPVGQWLDQQIREIMLDEGKQQGLTVLDTTAIISPEDTFFLPSDPSHLSAVGHEVLGQALVDCYQAKRVAPGFFELTGIPKSR